MGPTNRHQPYVHVLASLGNGHNMNSVWQGVGVRREACHDYVGRRPTVVPERRRSFERRTGSVDDGARVERGQQGVAVTTGRQKSARVTASEPGGAYSFASIKKLGVVVL